MALNDLLDAKGVAQAPLLSESLQQFLLTMSKSAPEQTFKGAQEIFIHRQ